VTSKAVNSQEVETAGSNGEVVVRDDGRGIRIPDPIVCFPRQIVHLGTQIVQGQVVTLLGEIQEHEVTARRQIATPFPDLMALPVILDASQALLLHHEAVLKAKAAWEGEKRAV
jgi:hypothetical protein